MREADGRGPSTSLTGLLLAHYKVTREQDLVRKVYSGDLKPSAIATLASIVQRAGEDGDALANQIIDTGAAELSVAALAVARRLRLAAPVVVLAGGIFRAVPRMRTGVTAHLSAELPGARIQPLDVEPALGAVRLAVRAAAGEAVAPVYVQDDF